MIALEIFGAKELAAKLGKAATDVSLASFRNTARATLETRNALFRAMSGEKVSDSFFGVRSPAGPVLAARTGHTRRALSPGRVWRVGNESFGAVGHPSAYVAALETGERIRPTASTFLRIPLAAALTGAGQDRNVGRSVRGVEGFFIYPTRKQRAAGKARTTNLFIARNVNGRLVLWYLLKTEVKLPEKRIFATVLEQMRPRYLALMGRGISTVVSSAN